MTLRNIKMSPYVILDILIFRYTNRTKIETDMIFIPGGIHKLNQIVEKELKNLKKVML